MEPIQNEGAEGTISADILEASNTLPFAPTSIDLEIIAALEGKKVYDFVKRVFDIVMATAALILLFPVMLVITAIIMLDDFAFPFYISTRCGKNGKKFKFIKFRSMHVNADKELDELLDKNEADGPVFKIENDPRITKVGKFIRRTSLDELPQIINVIKGDMSIVGPRPPIPREVEQYNRYQMHRLAVRPGLTCLWQVTPKRNSLSFDEWVDLDVTYIRERRFSLDIILIFKTIGVMFTREGQ